MKLRKQMRTKREKQAGKENKLHSRAVQKKSRRLKQAVFVTMPLLKEPY